jgi:hypothetical protein
MKAFVRQAATLGECRLFHVKHHEMKKTAIAHRAEQVYIQR